MTRSTLRTRFGRMFVSLAMGGSAFQISGCDPEVRQTLLDGLQATSTSLSGALISAFFQGLSNDGDSSGDLTTT